MKELKDFQIEAIHRKVSGSLIVMLGIVLVAGIGLAAKFGDLAFRQQQIANQTKTKTKEEITISGVPACLPLKSGEKVEKCEYGIKTSDGKYYAVSNFSDFYGEAGASGVNVTGKLIKAGEGEKFDIVGTIIQ